MNLRAFVLAGVLLCAGAASAQTGSENASNGTAGVYVPQRQSILLRCPSGWHGRGGYNYTVSVQEGVCQWVQGQRAVICWSVRDPIGVAQASCSDGCAETQGTGRCVRRRRLNP
ncbi:MAG: hypothetical protein AB7J28_10335 [Hyphomonadaceae bacterium]